MAGTVRFENGMEMGMVRFGNEMVGMVQFGNGMEVVMVQSMCEVMKGMDQSVRDRIRFILSVSDNKVSARAITEQKIRVVIHFSISLSKP